MFWVYILQNPAGKFYIGQTEDLDGRLYSHNREDKILGKFTRKNGPWELVWGEQHPTRAAAMARERQIKARKSSRFAKNCSMVESRSLGINRRVTGLSPVLWSQFLSASNARFSLRGQVISDR